MLTFHATAFAQPAAVRARESMQLHGVTVAPLEIAPTHLSEPFSCSFEEVVDRIGRLPRMFVEPDGSFVWVASLQGAAWQVDGQLHDRAGRLLAVDLKGTCVLEPWRQLLGCFGWPGTQLVFELVREGVFLTLEDFERYAAEAGRR